MAKEGKRGGLSTAEMMDRLAAQNQAQRAAANFPQILVKDVQKGRGTGNALVDMVIRRSGAYESEHVEPYRHLSELLQQNVGKIALVMRTRERQHPKDYQHDEPNDPHVTVERKRLLVAGLVTDLEPIIDSEDNTWSIATSHHAIRKIRPGGKPGKLHVVEGAMPIPDLFKLGDDAETTSLGIEVVTDPRYVFGPGPPGEGYPSVEEKYRLMQTTTVWLGGDKIGDVGNKSDFAPLIRELE